MPKFSILPRKIRKRTISLTLQAFLTKVALLCMLPLLLLTGFLAFNHIRTLQTHFDQDANRLVHNIANAIDDKIEAQISALQILASSNLIDDQSNWPELYDLALIFKQGFGGDVVFADDSMKMLFNTRTPFGTPLPKLPIPSGLAAAPAALATGKPSVGDSFIGPIANERLVAIAVPVFRDNHAPSLLLGVTETRLLQKLIDEVSIPSQWSLIILDGQNNVMAHCASNSHTSHLHTISCKRFVANSNASHWSVALDVPQAAYNAPIYSTGSAIAIGILFAVTAGFLGGRFFGLRLTQAVGSVTGQPSLSQTKIVEIEAVRASLRIASTARELSEKALKEREHVLKLFIEHAPAAIAMLDTNMNYIAVSNRYLIDYGIQDKDIVGRSHYDIFPEIPMRWKDIHQRCLSGNTERCDEDSFPRANGKTDWIQWEIRPWFTEIGKVGGIIIFSEVITEKVEAAESLKESERKFKDLFHKHAAVKLILNPDNGNIIDANEAAERFYGWTCEQLRRMRIQDINTLAPEKLKEEMEKVKKQQRIHFEFQHKLADGSLKDVAVYSSRIDIRGKALLHSIIHDISERKKAEREQEQLREQLVQAQKMESIGQLAGGVAHDYNNMLSVIIGYSELLIKKVPPDDPLCDDLKEILDAACRSAVITRQLLAFARKQTINPIVINLNETIEVILKMLRRLIGEHIELVWLPEPVLWDIEMDIAQVNQILTNLCVNARDAIKGMGKITIATRNVALDESCCEGHFGFVPGDFVMLTVSDNGSGMDKNILDHIFEPFFTTKVVGQGTGLGLSTVYGIVRQNNAIINVYSEIDIGTIFKIYFPRYLKEIESPISSFEATPMGNGERVLLVEDEQAILRMGKRMLENLGYHVLATSSPTDALRIAEETEKIQLLMTDVVMPEMNGRDLANRLQALYPNIKTLFMSGYARDVIDNKSVLNEGITFIQKPFSQRDIALKVYEALYVS